jgi:Cu-Zn family superoxide dismutase
MTIIRSASLIAAGLLAGAGALAQAQPAPVTAEFIDAQGKPVGSATLSPAANGVLIALDLRGLPPGEHGFHVHTTGQCDAASGFKSAGDHYAPQKHAHGLRQPRTWHAGDMPNQFVAADGTLRAHVLNTQITLGNGRGTLFDKDGSAIVLHAKPDDYKSQPSGDSGDRIACAVIKR